MCVCVFAAGVGEDWEQHALSLVFLNLRTGIITCGSEVTGLFRESLMITLNQRQFQPTLLSDWHVPQDMLQMGSLVES